MIILKTVFIVLNILFTLGCIRDFERCKDALGYIFFMFLELIVIMVIL